MRLLIAIAVTVAQVAGPWLCCCGPAWAYSGTVRASSQQLTPIKTECERCRQATSSTDATGHDRTTPDPCPSAPGKCPHCFFSKIDAVPPTPQSDAEELHAALRALIAQSATQFSVTAGVTALSPAYALSGLSDLHFLTTEQRLYSHHALRC